MTLQSNDISNIIDHLKLIFDEQNVLLDEESKQIYGLDLTQKYKPNPLAIVFPKSHEQVVSIVKLANEFRFGLVPSGGRTGYSGGCVAQNGEIVVSFERYNRIVEFNPSDRQLKCEPGVTTKAVQDFALENNLFYPVDFASSGSSHIAGNIATNAGGIKVIRYGLTRNWVAGLKVVTGAGDSLSLNYGLIKNACGYDIRHLFIGSEGTLGFITEATLQLTALPANPRVFLLLVKSDEHIIDILNEFDSVLPVTAFEFFSRGAMNHVIIETGLKEPCQSMAPFYILLEYESSEVTDPVAMSILDRCLGGEWLQDAIMSNNIAQSKALWRYRETISMSILRHSPYKFDIAVLPSKVVSFMNEANALLKNKCAGFEVVWFGHVGDGNLHLNLLKPGHMKKGDFFSQCEAISDELFEIISRYQGAISAEHGVGLLKKDFLHHSKSQVEINAMRAIKKVFDPNGVMNPGKIFNEVEHVKSM